MHLWAAEQQLIVLHRWRPGLSCAAPYTLSSMPTILPNVAASDVCTTHALCPLPAALPPTLPSRQDCALKCLHDDSPLLGDPQWLARGWACGLWVYSNYSEMLVGDTLVLGGCSAACWLWLV